MLRFKVHQFHLNRTHYVLLPKLNPTQLQIISKRFAKIGHLTNSPSLISARTREGTVHVDPQGLCWSLIDPADAILPAIPDILTCSKARVAPSELKSKYFSVSQAKGTKEVRRLVRLESDSLWKALRASGDCALSPDEHKVASLLMRNAGKTCTMVTDYPVSGSTERTFGRRRYFDSTLSLDEATSTLRMSGMKAPRNSYLLRDGILQVDDAMRFPPHEVADLLESLGEWCFFSSR